MVKIYRLSVRERGESSRSQQSITQHNINYQRGESNKFRHQVNPTTKDHKFSDSFRENSTAPQIEKFNYNKIESSKFRDQVKLTTNEHELSVRSMDCSSDPQIGRNNYSKKRIWKSP